MKTKSKKLRIAQRLMVLPLAETGRFPDMVEMLKSNRGAVDEVWFFTENDGQDFRFCPLPEVDRRAAMIAGGIEQLRKEGIGASINVLNTIGHSDYAEPFLDPLPWPGMVGHEGTMALCCSCPRQPAFRDYVTAKYTAYAKCKPDTIWIDDDTRLFYHPPRAFHGCYCELCLQEFSRRTGRQWDRTSIYQAIVRDDYLAPNADRQAWMHYLSDQLVDLHHVIRDAVHAVDPNIGLGGMNTQFGWYSAYYSRFKDRFEALRTSTDEVVYARPGGGAFSDDRPAELYHKAWSVAFQNEQYPPNTERLVEVENYPFQLFGKSAASTVREGSLYLAVGSEGVAFDVCGNLGNDPREHVRYLEAISRRRPYYEAIHASAHGSSPLGLNVAYNPEHAAWTPSDGKSLESTNSWAFDAACEWGLLGLPLRFASENRAPSILVGGLAKGMPPEMLEEILQQGAVMDVETLVHLWKIGLGPKVGVTVGKSYTTGTFERYVAHPLNHGFDNYVREISQGYYGSTSWTLEASATNAQPLSQLFNYRKEVLGTCSVALETPQGSRIVVLGYRPWDYLGLPGKSAQCRRIADWLQADKTIPRFDGKAKAVFHAWKTTSGRIAGVLYNASEDALIAPRLIGLPPSEKVEVTSPEMSKSILATSPSTEAVLPDLPPWGECLIST